MRRSVILIILTLSLPFLLTSCCRGMLSAHTEYLSVETLASYYVGTPDPRKLCPDIGQRLVVGWSLPPSLMGVEDLNLHIKIRYRNREEQEIDVKLCSMAGFYEFRVVCEDYNATRGILTYKVDLMAGDTLLEEWRHQLWTDFIYF